jgi:ComF family protein
MWMIYFLIDFLFPSQCIGCGKEKVPLCTRCVKLARKSLSAPHSYVISAFDFKDPLVKQAIHASKYYHRRDLVPPLSAVLAEELKKSADADTGTVLIPVPMHPYRKLLRGYNQAELIAEEVGRRLNLPVQTNVLAKIVHNKRQATIKHREDRLKNQKDTFAVISPVSGGTYILIDDVTTTGTTLYELRRILLKEGARSVRAGTLAH